MFRKKNFGKVIIFSFLFFLGGFIVWKFISIPLSQEEVIVYNGKEFSPNKVKIVKGGKVIFRNASGKDFWPSSDFHPDNHVYPEFDPGVPVESGGTWEFIFTREGEWGYHDHLAPYHKGTVVVKERTFSQIPNNCRVIKSLSYQERELCWYKEIKKVIGKRGIEGALALIQKLYQEESLFGQGCHDIMHLVGDEAYRQYHAGKHFKLGNETTYCGYGFYHGFVEAMLYTSADYSEVQRFCEDLAEPENFKDEGQNAMNACFHGIGHATFDAHDPSLWGSEVKMVNPAISVCETVIKNDLDVKVQQCVTGVFNALAIAYGNHQYNLEIRSADPVWFCRGLKAIYKPSCFREITSTWLHVQSGLSDPSFDQGASFIEKLNDKIGEVSSIRAFASEITRLNIGSFDADMMVNNCKKLKSILVEPCILGIEEGFLLWGKPDEEYKIAFGFCKSQKLSEDEKDQCFKYILNELRTKYSDEKMKKICINEIEEKFQKYCN